MFDDKLRIGRNNFPEEGTFEAFASRVQAVLMMLMLQASVAEVRRVNDIDRNKATVTSVVQIEIDITEETFHNLVLNIAAFPHLFSRYKLYITDIKRADKGTADQDVVIISLLCTFNI